LNAAIHYMRGQNKTVVIISHRPTAMAAVNKVLMLRGGQQEKFGLKEQIFKIGKSHTAKPRSAGPQGNAPQNGARRGPTLRVPQGSV